MKRYLALMILATLPVFAGETPNEIFIDEFDESALNRGDQFARITYAEEHAYLTREDQTEESLIRNLPVTSGDFIETRPSSFAELEFIDGSLMQFDRGTRVEFQAVNEVHGKDHLSIIKVHDGAVFLHVAESSPDSLSRVFRIDTVSGSAYIEAPGIYEVIMESGRMKLKVFRGFAELSGEEDSVPVYSGEYSTIRNLRRPTRVNAFNSFHTNRFERWAYSRRPVTENVSSGYVDGSLSNYSRDLDDNGEWRYEEDLRTHIWVPYVDTSWRPYNNGYWTSCGSLLTWVPYDPFGWVTHHYGRWGWNGSLGWYWIPGYHYSPAWVAWSSYDSYVGWCPLGYYNRPYYYNAYGRPVWSSGRRYNNSWTYVSSTTIINRSRNYTVRNVVHRGNRKITTRAVHVKRDDFRDSRGFLKVIRDPDENRARARVRTSNRKGTMVVRDRSRTERVRITGRNTGTAAVTRYLPEPGKSSRTRIKRGSTGTSTSRNVIRTSRPDREQTTRRSTTSRNPGTSSRGNTTTRTSKGTRLHTTSPTRTRDANTSGQRRATPKRSDSSSRTRTTPSRVNRPKPKVSTPTRKNRSNNATPPPSRSRSSATSNRGRTSKYGGNTNRSRATSSSSRSRSSASSSRSSNRSRATSSSSRSRSNTSSSRSSNRSSAKSSSNRSRSSASSSRSSNRSRATTPKRNTSKPVRRSTSQKNTSRKKQ